MRLRIKNSNSSLLWAGALGSAFAGALLLWVSMSQSVGIGGDAVIYLESARNFAAGRGIGLIQPDGTFRLIPYFPPFYPIVLAGFAKLGMEILSAAKLINLACFMLMIALVSWGVGRAAKRWYVGCLCGGLLAGSPILVPGYSWAMSEPLANLFAVGALAFLLRSFEAEGRGASFALSIGCAAAAAATRYSMILVPIAGAGLTLILGRSRTAARRVFAAFLYGAVSLLPLGGWMAYDHAVTATTASRSLLDRSELTHEIFRYLREMGIVIQGWFVPESWLARLDWREFPALAAALLLIGLLLIVLIAAATVRIGGGRDRDEPSNTLLLAAAAFILGYIALIGAVSVTTYPPITIGQRMFLPAHIAAIVVFSLLVGSDWTAREARTKAGFAVTALCGLLAVGFFTLRTVRIARQNAVSGFAFDAPGWRESETIAALKTRMGGDSVIVSNEETALRLYLERPIWQLREIYAGAGDPFPPSFSDRTAATGDPARAAILAPDGILVLFDSFEDQLAELYGGNGAELAKRLTEGLTLVYDGGDGKIYRFDPVP